MAGRFSVRRLGPFRFVLLFEIGGELVVWTMHEAPSRNPADKPIAVIGESRPLEQLWAEGPEAGPDGGPAIVFDTGRFVADDDDVVAAMARGKLRVELFGYKLRGTWALGRNKGRWRGRGKGWDPSLQWTLIKGPDEYAHPRAGFARASVLSGCDLDGVDGGDWLAAVRAAAKEIQAPRGRVPYKELRPVPMDTSEPFTSDEWLFELRRKGRWCCVARDRGRGRVIDDQGADRTRSHPVVAAALRALPAPSLVATGVLTDIDGREVVQLFDLLCVAGRDVRGQSLLERKRVLRQVCPEVGPLAFVDHIDEQGEAMCEQLAARGSDGWQVVARRREAAYDESEAWELAVDCARSEPEDDSAQLGPVRMSNRGKVFWPEHELTKGHLLDYYRDISEVMLPYLHDRPLVLTRFPDGIHGKSFFQHHAPGAKSAWLKTVRIDMSRRPRDYFICTGPESLIYLANLGTIPFHVWPSRVGSIDRPDWCVLDVDRSGATFADVVRVARQARALCAEIGLDSWVKTSGGSGLHVVVPLGGALDFDQCRAFAELLARAIEARHRDLVTTQGSIDRRGERVYLDYLVNARGRMLVAPYSVRGLVGAPVSTPLSWDEVDGSLDPAAFTIETVVDRVADVGDLWRELLGTELDISAAVEALAELL